MMSKVAKGKGKTRYKNEKSGKYTEEQDNESTDSFQNYDSRRLLSFCIKAGTCIKKRKRLFLALCMTFCQVHNVNKIWTQHET